MRTDASVGAALGNTPGRQTQSVAVSACKIPTWVAAKITAPIASATSVAQVEELVGAMNLELCDEQIAVLDAASA
jgi:aryl-alcohol dehydrogenase-like predicted oxidoreductase